MGVLPISNLQVSAPQCAIRDPETGEWLLFPAPVQVQLADQVEEVLPILRQVERLVIKEGLSAIGFISYEAAPAFDGALAVHPPDPRFPLAWFGLHHPGRSVHVKTLERRPTAPSATAPSPWIPSIGRERYGRDFHLIREHLAAGETYQVNHTYRLRRRFKGDPWDFFLGLVESQPTDYAVYLDLGSHVVCSVSPELFFRLEGDQILMRPMKGTSSRGSTPDEDRASAEWLRCSEKNRAENVMIVDMARNDLGRIAETGSVQVEGLFSVEAYPSLWQMTSTITARTRASFPEILTAIFPSASVTGAPKPNTMKIIAELETEPRRVYTGCIGYLAPGRKAQFNVAIRTALIDRREGEVEFGVGGGIVWDSDAEQEYLESRMKARVVTVKDREFSLLETLRWTPGEGFFLLDYHLRRVQASARFHHFHFNLEQVRSELASVASSLKADPYKVRLLLAPDGAVSVEAAPLEESQHGAILRVSLAKNPIDSKDPFLRHKTTYRETYDKARQDSPQGDDVLLWNERGEVTETTIANVVFPLGEEWVTPPLECGLLPGVYRAWMLDQGWAREQVVRVEDLSPNQRFYVVNSVRQRREAVVFQMPGG
jgi:para-aminobenzoate synthetase/4-amino-4-deoxychorismate lyase